MTWTLKNMKTRMDIDLDMEVDIDMDIDMGIPLDQGPDSACMHCRPATW